MHDTALAMTWKGLQAGLSAPSNETPMLFKPACANDKLPIYWVHKKQDPIQNKLQCLERSRFFLLILKALFLYVSPYYHWLKNPPIMLLTVAIQKQSKARDLLVMPECSAKRGHDEPHGKKDNDVQFDAIRN